MRFEIKEMGENIMFLPPTYRFKRKERRNRKKEYCRSPWHLVFAGRVSVGLEHCAHSLAVVHCAHSLEDPSSDPQFASSPDGFKNPHLTHCIIYLFLHVAI